MDTLNELSRARLLQILEIQNEIVATRLDLDAVMQLVADRAVDMTGAESAVVETPEGGELVYRAATGAAAGQIGRRLAIARSLSGMSLLENATLRCDDAREDPRVDPEKVKAVGARSILCVPLRHSGRVVGVLQISSPEPAAFDDEHCAIVEMLSGVVGAHLTNAGEFARLDGESRRSRMQAVAGLRALARAIDAKDPTTRRHSDRVALLARAIAQHRGWDDDALGLLHEAALLHDVGKIGVPDAVLLKPDVLTLEEYARVREHAALGAEILDGFLTAEQVGWVRWHHERPDGDGYPDGLTDAEIPEGAAIIALADAWDVMTVSRVYRPPMPRGHALEECRRLTGRQFRGALVAVLGDIV